MQSREKPTVKLSIAAGKRIELNELDARFNADEFWREGDPLTKTVYVAESDEAELIEKLKNHPNVLAINGKSIQRAVASNPEPVKTNNTSMLFAQQNARIFVVASAMINFNEIDPRLSVDIQMTHGFPLTARFFVNESDKAEIIQKLKNDARVVEVNNEKTKPDEFYHQETAKMFRITQS